MRGSLVRITEGTTTLHVPAQSMEGNDPPTFPIFFNPSAHLNRDVSVAVTEASAGHDFCDALCGVGARGVRMAKEVGRLMSVAFVDFNEESLAVARKNARANRASSRCEFAHRDANSFLSERVRRDRKFDYVDIDPFGTPARFLQAAFLAAADGAIVSVTATDTAVLCGAFPNVARRRYSAASLRSSFKHEVGARILLNSCRRAAAVNDIGVRSVFAHSTRHYIRVYLRVRLGSRAADEAAEMEGFVGQCVACRRLQSTRERLERCPKCRAGMSSAGPLWIGPIVEEVLLKRAIEACERKEFSEALGLFGSFRGVDDYPPYGYNLDEVASSVKMASVSGSMVRDQLASSGHHAMGQPFEKSGMKSNADYEEVVEAVRAVSSRGRGLPLHPMHT